MKIYLPLCILFLFFFPFLQAQDLYFPPTTGGSWETTDPATLNWCVDEIDPLYQYLDEQNSKAFLVLKDGKIVLEKYFDQFQQDSVWYWASAGKSLTAFLIGLAQQDGHLSITDKTSDYLGDWTTCSTVEQNEITVQHQLMMATGLNDAGIDVDCTEPSCLTCLTNPGERWAYHNAPYTLLQEVFENAVGQNTNTYIFQNIRPKTGISGAYVNLGFNKVFFSTPRVMARFGLLMLNNGSWANTPILSDQDYLQQMINTSQDINKSYGYLWWLNGKESYMLPRIQLQLNGYILQDGPDDMYMAMGKNGQYLNVIPSQNLIVLRMGDAPAGDDLFVAPTLNNEIWKRLNNVINCQTTSLEQYNKADISVNVFPNPARNLLNIQSEENISKVKLYDTRGKLSLVEKTNTDTLQLDITQLPSGIYWLEIQTENGIVMKKFLVN